mmetsp:Transcript_26574/g.61562  ORF Transcript_26574/g.61562 Transcript_26574/m.61562 type:complete len:320 (+) Transcript_26574:375-1334(+)
MGVAEISRMALRILILCFSGRGESSETSVSVSFLHAFGSSKSLRRIFAKQLTSNFFDFFQSFGMTGLTTLACGPLGWRGSSLAKYRRWDSTTFAMGDIESLSPLILSSTSSSLALRLPPMLAGLSIRSDSITLLRPPSSSTNSSSSMSSFLNLFLTPQVRSQCSRPNCPMCSPSAVHMRISVCAAVTRTLDPWMLLEGALMKWAEMRDVRWVLKVWMGMMLVGSRLVCSPVTSKRRTVPCALPQARKLIDWSTHMVTTPKLDFAGLNTSILKACWPITRSHTCTNPSAPADRSTPLIRSASSGCLTPSLEAAIDFEAVA